MPFAGKLAVAESTEHLMTISKNSSNDKPLSSFFDRFPRLLTKGRRCYRGSHKGSRVGPDIWEDEEDNDDDDDDNDGNESHTNSSDDDDDAAADGLDNEMYRIYLATLDKCKRPHHHHTNHHHRQQQQQYDLRIQIALAHVLQKTTAHKKSSSEENGRMLSTVIAAAKKPSTTSCRYMVMLLETHVDRVVQDQHPIRQALLRRRQPYLAVATVVTPHLVESISQQQQRQKQQTASIMSTALKKGGGGGGGGGSYWSRVRRAKDKKKMTTTTTTTSASATVAIVKAPTMTVMTCASAFRSASTAAMLISTSDDQDNVPLGLLRKKRAIA